MATRRAGVQKTYESAPLPIWQELLVGVEMASLRISPVYWGYGIPRGDGSAVVVVPGFLATDFYLTEFRAWLRRIGYTSFDSNIGVNAECPNLLIKHRLTATIEKAYRARKKKVHLIGHSLGGVLVRAVASQAPEMVASVITLGSPFRGITLHPTVLRIAQTVRGQILSRHGKDVLPGCYTGACTCRFIESLEESLSRSVRQTAIYSKADGIVDWRVCRTGRPAADFEVSATHIGMVFNPLVFDIVAHRLAGTRGTGSRPAP